MQLFTFNNLRFSAFCFHNVQRSIQKLNAVLVHIETSSNSIPSQMPQNKPHATLNFADIDLLNALRLFCVDVTFSDNNYSLLIYISGLESSLVKLYLAPHQMNIGRRSFRKRQQLRRMMQAPRSILFYESFLVCLRSIAWDTFHKYNAFEVLQRR